jgi:hypothetical protein
MQLESPDFSGKIFFAGALLTPDPKLSLRDAFDNEAWNSEAVVLVSLLGGLGNLPLIGSLALPSYSSTNADVIFPDLRVPRPNFGLTLKFCLEGRPSRKRFCGIDDRTVVMGPFDVFDLGSLHVQHHVVENMFAADTLVSAAGLPPTLILKDKSGNTALASGIRIRAMLNSYEPDKLVKAETEPELLGEQVAQSVEGVITFNNLLLQVSGNYSLSFQAEYSWTPGLDRAVASYSWLHAVTRFYVVPARESASCNKSSCILHLLDHSSNSTAGSPFTVQVLLTDPYQNRIARRRLSISLGLNPTSADLLGDLSVTTDDQGHAMFSVKIKAACNRLWCVRCNGTIAGQQGCTGSWISGAVGGYHLLIATGGVSVQTNLIEIFPDLDLVAHWINMTTIVQNAGQEVNPVPLFWPLDKYGNLFDTRGMPLEWEIIYEGIGFLPCADEEPKCEDMEERVKARNETRCLGASTSGYRPLQLRFRAPSKAGSEYSLKLKLRSYHPANSLVNKYLPMPTVPVQPARAVKIEVVEEQMPVYTRGEQLLGGGTLFASARVLDQFFNPLNHGIVFMDLEKIDLDFVGGETMQSDFASIDSRVSSSAGPLGAYPTKNNTVTLKLLVQRGSQLPTLAEAEFCQDNLNRVCKWPFLRQITFYFDPDQDPRLRYFDRNGQLVNLFQRQIPDCTKSGKGVCPNIPCQGACQRALQCTNNSACTRFCDECPRPDRSGMLKVTTNAFITVAGHVHTIMVSSMDPVYVAGGVASVRFVFIDSYLNVIPHTVDGRPVNVASSIFNKTSCFECACNQPTCALCPDLSPTGASLARSCDLVVVPNDGYHIVDVPLPVRTSSSVQFFFRAQRPQRPGEFATVTSTPFKVVQDAIHAILFDRSNYSAVYNQALDPAPRISITDRHGNLYGSGIVVTARFVGCAKAECLPVTFTTDTTGVAVPPPLIITYYSSYASMQNFTLRVSAQIPPAQIVQQDISVLWYRRIAQLEPTSAVELIDLRAALIEQPMQLMVRVLNAEKTLPVADAQVSISSCCRGPPLFNDCQCFTVSGAKKSVFLPAFTNETGHALLEGFMVRGRAGVNQIFSPVSHMQINIDIRKRGSASPTVAKTINVSAYSVTSIYVNAQPSRSLVNNPLTSPVEVGACVGDPTFPDACDKTVEVTSLAYPFTVKLVQSNDSAVSFDKNAAATGRTSNVYLRDRKAVFDAIRITGSGSQFRLHFSLPTIPPLHVLSNIFNVENPCSVHIQVAASRLTTAGEPLSITARALNFTLDVNPQFRPRTRAEWNPGCLLCKEVRLEGTKEITAVDGVAVFTDLSVAVTGIYNVSLFFPGSSGFALGIADVATVEFRVVNAAPSRLSIVVQPGAGVEGKPLSVQPVLRIFDAFGNPVLDENEFQIVANGTTSIQGFKSEVRGGFAKFVNLTEFLSANCRAGACGSMPKQHLTFSLYQNLLNPVQHISNAAANSADFDIFTIGAVHVVESYWHSKSPKLIVADQVARFDLQITTILGAKVPLFLMDHSSTITGCDASINKTKHVENIGGITVELLMTNALCTAPSTCQGCILTMCVFGVCNSTHVFEVSRGVYNETALVRQPTAFVVGEENTIEVRVRDQSAYLAATPQRIFIELKQGVLQGSIASAQLQTVGVQASFLFNESVAGIASFPGTAISKVGAGFQLIVTRCPSGWSYEKGRPGCCKPGPSQALQCDLYGIFSAVTSDKFSVKNTRLSTMNVFQNEVGEHSAAPELMVAGTRFDMKARLIDSKGNILASRPYEVQVSLSESGDAISNPNVLMGRGEITTITDFASEFAGSAHFTDLAITKAGNNWRLRFVVIRECVLIDSKAELCSETLANFAGLQRPQITVPQTTTIAVVHSEPAALAFSTQPVDSTVGWNIPTIAVDLIDVYGNPVSCTGYNLEQDDFVYREVHACRDPTFSSTGRFQIQLSLLAGCYTPDTCDGASLTDVSIFEERRGETIGGRVRFRDLSVQTPGFNFKFLARVTLNNGTVLTQQSDEFKVFALVYDFLEVTGCPSENSQKVLAGAALPPVTVLGVFQAFSSDRKLKMQANTQGMIDPGTGMTPGVYARARMCRISESTGYSVCGYYMAPPMVLGGITEVRFHPNGVATFDGLLASDRKDDAAVLILEVVSPFDGRVVEYRCPSIQIMERTPTLFQFLTEPHHAGDAGLVLTIQPVLEALDKFQNRVSVNPETGQRIRSYASICGECTCPCIEKRQEKGVTIHGPAPDAQWSVFSPSCSYCSASDTFLVDAESTADSRGRHAYPLIRILKAGQWKIVFALVGNDSVYLASSAVKIVPCTLKFLSHSASTKFGAVQPGDNLCTNGLCTFEARDAFGNFITDISLTLQASLGILPDRELAGFTIPETCACTGVNENAGQSPPPYLGVDYGISCRAWETDGERDCKDHWPMCTPGKWCCMSWCYVDKACPNAIPDEIVPGLFYSYEACTSDTAKVSSCPWKDLGSCPQRDVRSSALYLESEISGTKETMMIGGVAFFTDLHSRLPGRFQLEIVAFSADFGTKYSSEPFDVQVTETRRLMILTQPNGNTFSGNPLGHQPSLVLTDPFGNRAWGAGGDSLCGAVTASVVRWREPPCRHPPCLEEIRYVYGQGVGDTTHYPDNCENTVLDPCYVTATAQNGIADYSWLHVGGGAADAVVLNFTSGCCSPDPYRCICSSSGEPTRADRRYASADIRIAPCAWVASKPFFVKRMIDTIEITRYTSWAAEAEIRYDRFKVPHNATIKGMSLSFVAKNNLMPGDTVQMPESLVSKLVMKNCSDGLPVYPCHLPVHTVTRTHDGQDWNRFGPHTSHHSWTTKWSKLSRPSCYPRCKPEDLYHVIHTFEVHIMVGSHVPLGGHVRLTIDGFRASHADDTKLPNNVELNVTSIIFETGQAFPSDVKLLDYTGAVIVGADDTVNVMLVQMDELPADAPNSTLIGRKTISSVAGVAMFSDLTVLNITRRSRFALRFKVAAASSVITGVSQTYSVVHSKPAKVLIESFKNSAVVPDFVRATLVLHDAYGNEAVFSGGMLALLSIQEFSPYLGAAPPKIAGSRVAYFHGSTANFRAPDNFADSQNYSSAALSAAGQYVLRFVAFTDPSQISFEFTSFREWRVRSLSTVSSWCIFQLSMYDEEGRSLIDEGTGRAIYSASASDAEEDGVPGYEAEQALLGQGGSWGGRLSKEGKVYLGWSFGVPTRVARLEILQAAPSTSTCVNFITRMIVEARNAVPEMGPEDGWVQQLSADLGDANTTQILPVPFKFEPGILNLEGIYSANVSKHPIFAHVQYNITTGPIARISVLKADAALIAWEPFDVELEASDALGNLIRDADGRLRLTSKGFSTEREPLGTLAQDGGWSPGCFADMRNGKASLQCVAHGLPQDADSYQAGYVVTVEVAYCLGEDCSDFKISSEYGVVFSAPVHSMAFYSCIPDEICQRYYRDHGDPRDCDCIAEEIGETKPLRALLSHGWSTGPTDDGVTKRFPWVKSTQPTQVANEYYFEKPEIRLLDDNGKLCTFSKLSVDVYMSSSLQTGSGCAKLLGPNGVIPIGQRVSFTALGGVVRFSTIGTHVTNCPIKFDMEFVFETKHIGRSEVDQLIGLIWLHTVGVPVDKLVLEHPMANIAAGESGGGVTVALHGRCQETECSNTVPIDRSTSRVVVDVFKVPRPGVPAANASLLGTTTAISIRGRVIFTDLSMARSGSYYMQFRSDTIASSVRPLTSPVFKVSPSHFSILKVVSAPDAILVGIPYCEPIEVELADMFGNRVDCQFAECAEDLYGYPEQVDSRPWFLQDGSNTRVQTEIVRPPDLHEPYFNPALTKCAEISGSVYTSGVRGLVDFGCMSTGLSGRGISLRFFAPSFEGGLMRMVEATSKPFVVIAGDVSRLFVLKQPKALAVAGELLSEIEIVLSDECGNPVTTENTQGLRVFAEDTQRRPLVGELVRKTRDGFVYYNNVQIRQASQGVKYRLKFYVGVLPDVMDITIPIEVVHAPGKQIAIRDQPVSVVQGLRMSAVVSVLDEFKNIAENEMMHVIAQFTNDGCEPGAQCAVVCEGSMFHGKCYRLVSDKLTWDEARQRCIDWGGNLASIATLTENFNINTMMRGESAWIGLRYSYGRGIWEWQDPTLSPVTVTEGFTSWGETKPDESGKQNCIALANVNAVWNSNNCSQKLSSICAKKMNKPSTSDELNLSRRCSCCQRVAGTSKVQAVRGIAVFDNAYTFAQALGPDKYRLVFKAVPYTPTVKDLLNFGVFAVSQTFEVYPRTVALITVQHPGDSTPGQPFPIQPIVNMIDGNGNRILNEAASLHATLEWVFGVQEGFYLNGTRTLASKAGQVIFTDLSITSRDGEGANRAFVIRFIAVVGPVGEQTTIFARTRTFMILKPAASLALDTQPKEDAYAGEDLGTLTVRMLDQIGKLVLNSNLLVRVSVYEAATDNKINDNVIRGNKGVACKGGLAKFTDLSLVKSSGQNLYKLRFDVAELGLKVISASFRIRTDVYVSAIFTQQPVDVKAGEELPDVTVILVDNFGNPEALSGVEVRFEAMHDGQSVGQTRTPQPWIEVARNVTKDGQAGAKGLAFTMASNYKFRFRLRINLDECKEERALLRFSYEQIGIICDRRYNLRVESREFKVLAANPSKIVALKHVSLSAIAGQRFSQQPECRMLDAYDNVVTGSFDVSATAHDINGDGCMCDFEIDDDRTRGCISSAPAKGHSIRVCSDGDCPVDDYADPAIVQSTVEKSVFNDLACTRQSCRLGQCRPYNISCVVYAPPNCNPCSAHVGTISIEPNTYQRLIPGELGVGVAGDPLFGRPDAGFYAAAGGGLKVTADMVKMPPSFFTADKYGNFNPSLNGVGSISIQVGSPDMAGYSFCTSPESNSGTKCLNGVFSAPVLGGFAEFTDVYIRHPGPGYKFRFHFNGIFSITPPFDVLPPPPRVIGAFFSPSFTGLTVKFDAETNQGDMGDSIACNAIFSAPTLTKLGNGAVCSWADAKTLDIILGNDAQLVPEGTLEVSKQAKIFSRIYFDKLPQTDGSTKNQRIDLACIRFDTWKLDLKSPLLHVPACVQVVRPQQLLAAPELPNLVEDHVSVSDAELFEMDGEHYVLSLYRCKGSLVEGKGWACMLNPTLRGPSQHYNLDSKIYRWKQDGTMVLHQVLPTRGATDCEHFVFEDAIFQGGETPNDFLVIANSISDEFNSPSSVTLWVRRPENFNLFSLRQEITKHIDIPSAVKVRYHEYSVQKSGFGVLPERSLLLIVANTGQTNAITVFKWVPGSFRAPGGKSWVDGKFDDVQDVQSIPALQAQNIEVYNVGPDLYLTVANSEESGSYRTPVVIYKWTRDVSCSSADKMCFRPQISLPALGARSVTAFSLPGPAGLPRYFLGVANHLEGEKTTEISAHYVVDTYIYEIYYDSKTSRLLQALQSYGANKITVFERCENVICESFLAISNQQDTCGPYSYTTKSHIFKWTSTFHTNCAEVTNGMFHLVQEVTTTAALSMQYKKMYGKHYLVQVSGGPTGISFHQFDSLIPVPEPIVEYASSLGPCNALQFDARSSLKSGGRDFTSFSWKLVSDLPAAWQKSRPGMLPYALAKLHEESSAVVNIDSTCLSGFYVHPVSNYSCMNSSSLPVGIYTIRLSIVNWIGASAYTDLVFKKSSDPLPIVIIVGPSVRTVFAEQETVLEGISEPSSCSSGQSTLVHTWRIEPPLEGVRISTSGDSLTIPENRLIASKFYHIFYTVSQGEYSATAQVTVTARMPKPIAKIDSSDRVIGLKANGTVLLLDASQSYIPGYEAMALAFVWKCEYFVKIGEIDQGYQEFDCSMLSSQSAPPCSSQFYVDSGMLALPPSRLIDGASDTIVYTEGCLEGSALRCDPSAQYRITVAVSDLSMASDACEVDDSLASKASVVWGTSPKLNIDVNVALGPFLKSHRISNGMDITFMGGVKNVATDAQVSYLWVQMKPGGIHNILSPLNMLTSIQSQNLAVKSGLLQGKYMYRFRLYASLRGDLDQSALSACHGACGWAEIEVEPNTPPQSGRLSISPSIGDALLTPFRLSAEQWEDEDQPMKYTFSYIDPGGLMKYIAVLTGKTQAEAVLPPGCEKTPCPGSGALGGGSCFRLNVTLSVTDALGSKSDTMTKATVRMPDVLTQVINEKIMVRIKELIMAGNGGGVLALAGSLGDLLNHQTLTRNPSMQGFYMNTRREMTESIQEAVQLLLPLSVGDSLHALGAIWAVCGRASELEATSRDIASNLVAMISDEVLDRLSTGDSTAQAQAPTVASLMKKILGSLLTPSAGAGRRSDTRRDIDVSTAMQTIANVEKLSRIIANGHELGYREDVVQDTSYVSITKLVTEDMLSSMNRHLIGSVVGASSLIKPQVVAGSIPQVSIWFPNGVALDQSTHYEVQMSLLYGNPLSVGLMEERLKCLDERQTVIWSSTPVDVPKNNMGEVIQESLRPNVATYKNRACSVLGNALILIVRKHRQASHVTKLARRRMQSTPLIRLRLPFDPMLRNEIRTNLQDQKSGQLTTVSCVYWDAVNKRWSAEGLQRVNFYLGSPINGSGAYVECTSDHLSIFAVSEVPADCKGTPYGTVKMDDCGVCGGDNSTCSGCDGIPNSGRTKDCSGHGRCVGNKCSCNPMYHGIVCHVLCDPAVNCSGHGRCAVEYEGLSVKTKSYCVCEASYAYPYPDDIAGELPMPTCVFVPKKQYVMPPELFYGLTVGAPAFLVCCSCCLFWCCISRMQAKKVKTMKGDLERYMVSYESANKLEDHEVEVDLCMPLGPTNFDAPPNRGNEKALHLTKVDRTKIQEATRTQDLKPESEVLHSSNRPHLGFADSSDSDSDEDEEDTMKHEAQDNRVERLRMIRAMRQTVARAAAAGPTESNSDDVEVAV